jgi:catalase-peroxidase
LIWQDPVPSAKGKKLTAKDIESLKTKVLASKLTISQLVTTAWASASTFRGTDKRGGANGARIALEPQRNWEVNNPKELVKVLDVLKEIQAKFNKATKKNLSLADLIVIAGNAGVEKAAKKAGVKVTVPFAPGRTDATQEMTDATSFSVLEPHADGFRNFAKKGLGTSAEFHLVDKAALLNLSAPEMTVLVGGMRVLGATADGSKTGVLTAKPEVLSTDFFVNVLDIDTTWTATNDSGDYFEGRDRKSGKVKWTATRADLVFGSNSVLRALSEVYASADAKE